MAGHLEIRNLRKTYEDGSIVAVDDLSIDIEEGEMLIFVGPSGCGKSTTLRSIAGLETVTSGNILLDGRDITNLSPQKRDIAMVFQDYALYPHMTARKNIGFGLKMGTDMPANERNERVERVAEMMDITDILDKRPPDLSGGQQQRVALGRAIVRDPAVFLMDEPLSNLDAKLRTKMRTEIQQIQQELAVTTIYVTHNQTEAMTMGDRIAVMNDGQLQQLGTPTNCYRNPSNMFVASFIGSPAMNFIDVTYDAANRTVSDESSLSHTVSEEVATALSDGEFVLGVRPEAFAVVDDPTDGDISMTVTVVEPRGDVTYLFGEYNDTELTVTIPIRHRQLGGQLYEEGQEVWLSVPEKFIYLFDRETTESIVTPRSLAKQRERSSRPSDVTS